MILHHVGIAEGNSVRSSSAESRNARLYSHIDQAHQRVTLQEHVKKILTACAHDELYWLNNSCTACTGFVTEKERAQA